MKKKWCCLLNRFAALIAALVLCLALCVPCFASNNASTKKWVIVGEQNMNNEQGTQSKYFHLTPYSDGEVYAAVLGSYYTSFRLPNSSSSEGQGQLGYDLYGLYACNYPDWWRSSIPLGAVSYVQVDVKSLESRATPYGSGVPLSTASLRLFDLRNSISFAYDVNNKNLVPSIPASSGSVYQNSSSVPFFFVGAGNEDAGTGGLVVSPGLSVSVGESYVVNISQFNNVILGPSVKGLTNQHNGIGFAQVPLMNLSSDDFVIAVSQAVSGTYTYCTAEISFWCDATKLSPGLKVGDEFPSDSDAFDRLRDELLDQFPEAGDYIENGKSTIQGWNDTDTVDTDVASTSISALSAIFQNLGGFLFIISLMVFGAVVLRMLIRKAVDG